MPLTGTTQIVTFIAKNPKLSREEFYKHWSTIHAPLVAPWAEKHGIISYRQQHSAGEMVPCMDDSAPNANRDNLPKTPQAYDGFVIWEVESVEKFQKAFTDPYYLEFIEPDEHNLIDKNSFARGIIATFSSPIFEVLKGNKSQLSGGNTEEFKKGFDDFEAKQKS